MLIALGADHAGFLLKQEIVGYALDLGTGGPDPVDYPYYAEAVGQAIRENRAERGTLLCGSGVGASVAANKLPGMRAGTCHDTPRTRE